MLYETRDVCGATDDGSIRAEADEALAFALAAFTPFSSPLTIRSRCGDLRLGRKRGGFGSLRRSRALSAAVGGEAAPIMLVMHATCSGLQLAPRGAGSGWKGSCMAAAWAVLASRSLWPSMLKVAPRGRFRGSGREASW